MNEQLCTPLDYHFKRGEAPNSGKWYMEIRRKVDVKPSFQTPGVVGEPTGRGDHVLICVAVPCNESGEPFEGQREVYDERAESELERVRPGAELA